MAKFWNVFISSTSEDLKAHRDAARDAVLRADFYPVMIEYFAASGNHPPLNECLSRVSDCDVLICIVAERYGWVPDDQPGNDNKSIIWLECEQAAREAKEILVFLLDHRAEWPVQLRESYRIVEALESGADISELLVEVKRNLERLKAFKQWLKQVRMVQTFTNASDLQLKITAAMFDWRERHLKLRIPDKLSRPLRVFLCHSSGDKPAVRELYEQLNNPGVEPWLDEESLIPGQDWDAEIRKAVRASDVVIVCLSSSSLTKEGYVQKEIKQALDVADEKPEGTIFLIPLRLEECEVPERLRRWHWVNYFEKPGHKKLVDALQKRAAVLGLTVGNG